MHFLFLFISLNIFGVQSAPFRRAVPENLVPEFGHRAGLNPTGTGDCDGILGSDGRPIKVPCQCPPARDAFIESLNANVAAGHAVNNPSVAVSFPVGESRSDQLARIGAALVTLQNLRGPGVGCPAASTTFVAQQRAIQEEADIPTGTTSSAGVSPTQDANFAALAPDLGFQSGVNPTGTGDCDGAVLGPDNQPIKIPCQCPPARDAFIAALTENVNAGHAVNNPSIAVTFPLGDSESDEAARIQASLVTLQNLRGPGVGCPAASTTLLAQLKELSF